MVQVKSVLKIALLMFLSIIGSIVPFFFVAPIVRVAYLNYSRLVFWSTFLATTGLLFMAGFIPIGISLLGVILLVGIFSEIYIKYKNMFASGLIALFISFIALVSATQQWLILKGTTLSVQLQEQVQLILKQAIQVNPKVKIEPDYLVSLAPSALMALMLMSLALALILEQPISRLLNFPLGKTEDLNLLNFKLPDSFIWIAMVSFLLSFIDIKLNSVSILASNLVNLMVVLYFFQGLAVIEVFFTTLKFGFFIRFMTYVVFLVQLFFLVAAIGVIDFWVEFRKRFVRIRINQ